MSWLHGVEGTVTVLAVGGPDFRPDTLSAPGQYYQPYQAHVFRGWYPLSTPIYVYSRVVEQDVSLGYIAFVTSTPGQKVIQNNGLVPVTVPVRLVNITHDQVK